MKLISLNTWGGRSFEPFIDFIKSHKDTDIFCFQEVNHSDIDDRIWHGAVTNQMNHVLKELPGYQFFFSPAEEALDDLEPRGLKVGWGMAILVKPEITVEEHGEHFVHKERNSLVNNDGSTLGRNLHYITVIHETEKLHVVNFHGLWNGQGKSDTPERLEQSRKLKAFVNKMPGRKLICGDFNLLPDTESLKIVEEGMRNLITEHGITSTRTDLYTKPLKYADYIFVSPETKITSLEVPNIPVSDHRPLILHFN